MIDLVKKVLYTGLGAAALTKEKIEELASELVAKGAVSETEGRRLADELLEKSQGVKKDLQTQIDTAVQKALAGVPLSSLPAFAALENRVKALEEKCKGA